MIYAFKWYIEDKEVVTPDVESNPRQQFIECNRGSASGRACFYVRREDADALFSSSAPKKITAEVYSQDEESESGGWTLDKTISWQGYYLIDRDEVNQRGNVYITLRDKRHLLERATMDKPFNSVFLVGLTSATSRTLVTIYNDATCLTGNTPYTFVQILADAFMPSGLSAPAIPGSVTPDSPVDNIQCTGTCADVIAGLLASIGCDLKYDPFTGTLSIIKLSDPDNRSALATAKSDGRLLHEIDQTIEDTEKHGELVILPADYFPIRNVKTDRSNFGTGKMSVNIRDHQLADETTFKSKAARITKVKQAVQDWYLAESDSIDQTFWGILEVVPSEKLRCVKWFVSNGKSNEGHRTRVVNDAIEIPWVQRTEHVYQPTLRGKTTSTGLGSGTLEKVTYLKSNVGAGYTDSGYFVEAVTDPGTIAGVADVFLFPTDTKWNAVKVC